jgi:hypothetical protein
MGINIGKILNAIATGARTAGPLVSLANPLVGGAMVAGGNLLDDEGDFVDRMKRAAIGGGLTFAGGKLAGGGAPGAPPVPGAPAAVPGAVEAAAAPAVAGAGRQGGILARIAGAPGDAMEWLTDEKRGANRLGLLQTGLSAAGGYMEGQAEDEDRRYRRRRNEASDPSRERMMRLIEGSMDGGY